MENKIENFQCSGCGAKLQDLQKNQAGYLNQQTLEKLLDEQRPLLCQRCFRLLHYKEVTPLEIGASDFATILKQIPAGSLIIAVTDIFDLSDEFFALLKQFPASNQFVIVINKIEDLPRDYKIAAVQDWVRNHAIREKISLRYIVPVSAKTKYNIDILSQILNQELEDRELYFVGNANVGKSSLINALIKSQAGKFIEPAISSLPGTTLNFLTFKNGSKTWYDTPGLLLTNQAPSFLSLSDWQILLPQKRIRPLIFQIQAGQSIFIGGLGWLDYKKGPKISLVFYFNSQVVIHRRKTSENEDFYVNHVGDLLFPPQKLERPSFRTNTFQANYKYDLVFPAMGWVTVSQKAKINLTLLEPLKVSLRKAIV
ncbi:ribosome biogenesis GTPase YqeH [Xylocopilactobacillus apicola]|uniref:Ribosome biogenesis GTPase YqeH n=1 Tax=Xylocopilactobacillus apicola TaxID=2932184 RepID=A0AAU9D3F0_9LACO|nr:ribosome biogenesis GTPase YqeH [Xylocopilactobacillus apicola]BDR58314.1 ribosome biogenesis GTPase YqeH [Xylocopilactobacillus apicola]